MLKLTSWNRMEYAFPLQIVFNYACLQYIFRYMSQNFRRVHLEMVYWKVIWLYFNWMILNQKRPQLVQGSLYYQPKQYTFIREFPQSDHIFALFDPPNLGNVMTPVVIHPRLGLHCSTNIDKSTNLRTSICHIKESITCLLEPPATWC